MAAPRQSLRDRQVEAIQKLLNLNHGQAQPPAELGGPSGFKAILNEEGEPIWKVLVFDSLGLAVISSVLRVQNLRTFGITIHLHINSVRHPIADVPVIYLVEPTPENISRICSDLSKNLYESAYVNFLSAVPRPLLEDFAASTAQQSISDKIAQVYDQYLNFVVSEPDLFSLHLKDVYYTLNSAHAANDVIESTIDKIVSGLFSVAVTMGSIPIIRCPAGNAAEMIAQRLDRKLRDHVLNSQDSNLFSVRSSGGLAFQRPVLIILDRTIDLVPMLSHPWTYQALVHDVLKMNLNRITVNSVGDGGKSTTKSYDLNPNDAIWAQNASLPFPEAAANIDAELQKYQTESAEIIRKTGANSIEDLQNDASSSAAHLRAAITQLPELRERKAGLDMHVTIATEILKQGMKERHVAEYFELEANIAKQSKAQMLEMINDPDKKNASDKLRAFIVWYLSSEGDVDRGDVAELEAALAKAGCSLEPVAHIKKVRQLTKMTMMASAPQQAAAAQSTPADLFRGFSSLSSRLTDRIRESGALGGGFENLISGVKNFLPVNKDLTVTRIVESIVEPASAPAASLEKTESYLYFDPRSSTARGTTGQPSGGMSRLGPDGRPIQGGPSFGQRRQGFTEAVVMIIGGGNMEEYGNLQEWSRRASQGGGAGASRRRIVYGSTNLVNAQEFVDGELMRLGAEG